MLIEAYARLAVCHRIRAKCWSKPTAGSKAGADQDPIADQSWQPNQRLMLDQGQMLINDSARFGAQCWIKGLAMAEDTFRFRPRRKWQHVYVDGSTSLFEWRQVMYGKEVAARHVLEWQHVVYGKEAATGHVNGCVGVLL
ncbi:MAG: hypothetical protein ABJF88_18420 [Rhodothermales bacterium]|uniref:hypothetical protein n=1 Tax=Roseibium sp. TaxID=1936156 RepID=UPI003282CEE7